jgi:hypothetical protein
MIGGGPDPAHVVRVTRERCHVALMGNHDYAATGAVEPGRLGDAAAAWMRTPRGARPVRVRVGEPLELGDGKWLLNPGAVGAPVPPRGPWWDGLDGDAPEGAFWLLLDLERRTATWRRAPYDPAPARERARALGLDAAATAPRG